MAKKATTTAKKPATKRKTATTKKPATKKVAPKPKVEKVESKPEAKIEEVKKYSGTVEDAVKTILAGKKPVRLPEYEEVRDAWRELGAKPEEELSKAERERLRALSTLRRMYD